MSSPVAPERRPLSVDVNGDDEVRRRLAQMVSEQIMTRREPAPAIHFLKDDHGEVLDWTRVRQADPDADLPATRAVVAARGDVGQ